MIMLLLLQATTDRSNRRTIYYGFYFVLIAPTIVMVVLSACVCGFAGQVYLDLRRGQWERVVLGPLDDLLSEGPTIWGPIGVND